LPLAPAARSSAPMSHADCRDIRFDILHGVIDSQSRGRYTTWGIEVQVNVLIRVLGLQKEHLRYDDIGHVILDLLSHKDDPIL
jgi:hypothetical protein